MIEKDIVELCHYTVKFGDLLITPTYMQYDEEQCSIKFMVTNQRNFQRTIVREGKHNIPFTVNLETNVIKKKRKLDV